MVMGLDEVYLATAIRELQALRASQLPAIRRAGDLLADTWRGTGCLFVARTNHTLHTELVGRAGGPVRMQVLDDGGASYDEEVRSLPDVRPGDLILVHSNCGNVRKTASIVALARGAGVHTVALTQVDYERGVPETADRAGLQLLHQAADVTVDLGGVLGDAALDVPGSPVPICPTSGVTGVAAAWAIIARACRVLAAEGAPPPMLRSVQLPGAVEDNAGARAAWQTARAER
jgi:uncharacterized phosphosugar-binding protein